MVKELSDIQNELNCPKSQFNEFGKYHYRNCEDILNAVKPLLKKHGASLTVSDELVMIGERYYIKATATFMVGDNDIEVTAFAREEEAQKGMNSAQITGSTSSYARKYALNGLFCIDDVKDPDTTNKHGKEENPAITASYNKPSTTNEPKCMDCGSSITAKVYEYSAQKHGKPLCMDCQKKVS